MSARATALAPLTAALVVALGGCPSRSNDAAPSPSSTGAPDKCVTFGQTCQVAPGKLGSCVEKADCTGGDCLICQSQH